ncbi:MAG: glycosyltransferase family 39 protein [Candidatus Omnitrophica bacterium]|nr:glycosyltransferase family 39 protein [Candidatus Omnitrophota bacterium]
MKPEQKKYIAGFNQRKTHIILVILLIGVVAIIYANSFGGPFLFDDNALVKNNTLIRTLSNIPKFFKTDIWAYNVDAKPISNSYRPIQVVTYAIDFFLYGNDPKGFHFTNILVHLFNVLLVFLLVKEIFNNRFMPFFVSLLFGIHPANTACVSYISGRADVLVTAFMLLSIISYIKYVKNERLYFLLFSVLSYSFAVYSKEYAILVVPCILFLYNIISDRKIIFKIKPYIFYILPLALYLPMRMHALTGLTSRTLELSTINLLPRLLTSLKTLFIDIRILFLPYDLHFGRSTKVEYSIFGSPYSILTILGLVLVTCALRRMYKKWKIEKNTESGIIFFGISWFFASMIPLLNVFPLQVFHADSWLYFSSIGVYIAFAAAINYIWQLLSKKSALFRNVLCILICFMFLYYGYTTVRRNEDYQSEIKFYLSSVKWRPSVKFYRVIGGLYGKKGDYNNAVKYLQKAIEVNKTYPSPEVTAAYYNLGITYMRLSEYKKAEETFEKVMMSNDESLKKETAKYLLYIKRHR